MKRNVIRGVRIERIPYEPPGGAVKHLRYGIDIYDERGNVIEVLGRSHALDPTRSVQGVRRQAS